MTLSSMVNPVSSAQDSWVIHCDGSASPNPGSMGLGVVPMAPDGTRHTLSQGVPDRG